MVSLRKAKMTTFSCCNSDTAGSFFFHRNVLDTNKALTVNIDLMYEGFGGKVLIWSRSKQFTNNLTWLKTSSTCGNLAFVDWQTWFMYYVTSARVWLFTFLDYLCVLSSSSTLDFNYKFSTPFYFFALFHVCMACINDNNAYKDTETWVHFLALVNVFTCWHFSAFASLIPKH